MTTKLRASGIAPTPSSPRTAFGNAPTNGRSHGTEIDVTSSFVLGRFKTKLPQAEEIKK